MRQVTIFTTDKEYDHFLELARALPYVKRIDTDEEDSKEEIIHNIKEGLEELKLYKEGKLELRAAKDLLDEL
jgi:hypothetical protein